MHYTPLRKEGSAKLLEAFGHMMLVPNSKYWLMHIFTLYTEVTTDNYLITVDSYQRQLYQIEVDTGDVNAIPLTKAYKGVALDINPISNKVNIHNRHIFILTIARI